MVILNERNVRSSQGRDALGGDCLLIALRDYSFDNYIGGLVKASSIVAYAKPQADAK